MEGRASRTVHLGAYLALLGTYLVPQWPRVLLLGVLLCAGVGLELTFPQLVRHFIDAAQGAATVPAGATGAAIPPGLLGAAALYLGAAVAAQVVATAEAYVSTDVGQTATDRMRSALTLHCLGLDPPFHHAHTPGELIERIDGDVGVLAGFFSRFVVDVLGNLILLIAVLVLLSAIDRRLGLAFGAFALAATVLVRSLQGVPVPYRRAARQASAAYYGFLEERLAGAEDVHTSGAVDYTMVRWHERLRELVHRELKGRLVTAAATNVSGLLAVLATVLAFVLGAWLASRGEITLGTVYLLLAYTALLQRPIEQLNRRAQDLATATASLGRIQELFALRPSIADGDGPPLPAGPLSVAFEDVSFAYPTPGGARRPSGPSGGAASAEPPPDAVLRDVRFGLAPGEVLGVLGRTGSGKTTLSRLLLRLYEPGRGTIRLGGVDLRRTRLAELRQRVGLVTQEVQLFHASVRDNLTFFERGISDQRLVEVIGELGLSPWLAALPAGLDSTLPPGGGGLSAGQAQLLALARVFLRDPGVVILDEASSRLDPATEGALERAVERLLAGRTAIVIAHRLATVARADKILILEGGRVVEFGSRTALLGDAASRYRSLLASGAEAVA
ncbi:MAG TPA: ABC transporter ATP-binding protein [Chloroflexota bacterium]|jgi:ATP-binding cassette subfamily B protein|nr:ABC transporter ATP-binding protein [Chloroflexota bacterium]